MVTMEAAAQLALELPDVTEGIRHGHRTWSVNGKAFAWERPFSKADLKRFGSETPPDGPILALSVEDLSEKEAVLAAQPDAFSRSRTSTGIRRFSCDWGRRRRRSFRRRSSTA